KFYSGTGTDLFEYLDADNIDRVCKSLPHGDIAAIDIVVILRLPRFGHTAVVLYRRVVDDRCGGHSVLKGSSVDYRPEGRAGVSFCMGGPVELALLEVIAANHCLDTAGSRIHGKQRSLCLGGLVQGKNGTLLLIVRGYDLYFQDTPQ